MIATPPTSRNWTCWTRDWQANRSAGPSPEGLKLFGPSLELWTRCGWYLVLFWCARARVPCVTLLCFSVFKDLGRACSESGPQFISSGDVTLTMAGITATASSLTERSSSLVIAPVAPPVARCSFGSRRLVSFFPSSFPMLHNVVPWHFFLLSCWPVSWRWMNPFFRNGWKGLWRGILLLLGFWTGKEAKQGVESVPFHSYSRSRPMMT
jgi:hypothetical protein